ncbi:MAG: hypothetical protein GY830_03965 [Bacteroidetes bacterium]|nr:hypothetical protein [Bacteroidota bacterium]
MADNKTFIEEFTKPSEVIGSTIADKKSQIITAKPELLNIGDESAYKSFQELYENSN